MQWFDTVQSQQAKDFVEQQARWAAKCWQRMVQEEQQEEKCKKDQEEIRKRIEEVDRKAAAEREVTGRESERGHAVRRKPGPKQLGRANILGALSRVVPCNPGILHSIRHGRFRCNKKLPCRVHMPLQLVVYVFCWELDSVCCNLYH